MTKLATRVKYLKQTYAAQAKPGTKAAVLAACARIQASIEEAHRRIDDQPDGADGAPAITLLRAALEAEGRLIKLLYVSGIAVDTTVRRRSPHEEREVAQREAYEQLTGKKSKR